MNKTRPSARARYQQHKISAEKRGIESTLSYEDFYILKSQDCFYCDIPNFFLEEYSTHLHVNTPWMTLDRKDNSKGYTKENTVACCYLCNRIKSNFFSVEEMRDLAQRYVKPKWSAFKDDVQFDLSTWKFF